MFECARAKMARKSRDLLHRSCWVALEIHLWRTSPKGIEIPLGETIITAQPGGESDRYDGGAGYSGGGGGSSNTARDGGDGGKDGGDGDNSAIGNLGGRGSGQDISTTIHLQQFSLTPGRGGQKIGMYGGGGGGIMVDGSGPQDTVYIGQGYGGGKGGYSGNPGTGLVLLEIKPKQWWWLLSIIDKSLSGLLRNMKYT